MRCANCGQELPEDAAFFCRCGARVEARNTLGPERLAHTENPIIENRMPASGTTEAIERPTSQERTGVMGNEPVANDFPTQYSNRAKRIIERMSTSWLPNVQQELLRSQLKKRLGLVNGKAGFIDGKWGFVDAKENMVVPAVYNSTNIFRNGLAAVELDGKWGFVDAKGDMVVVAIYDDTSFFNEDVAPVGGPGCLQ